MPENLQILLIKNKNAATFFNSLAFTNRKEYVEWILSAKKEETKQKRLTESIEKLSAGKKNPSGK